MQVALITGGSAGLGLAMIRALTDGGWTVVTDSRHPGPLARIAAEQVLTVPGDIADPTHRDRLAAEVNRLGQLDLLMHNASTLGPLPMTQLRALSAAAFTNIFEVNVGAPLLLTQLVIPILSASRGILLSVSSDASVSHYECWGGYGASKAALDHVVLTVGAEEGIKAYAVDPGDMRTQMQQDAFPGEDISDRPLPDSVVPHLLGLIQRQPESGRYQAAAIAVQDSAARQTGPTNSEVA
ncbi:MAG: SDR family NAD(P)-dependent oxidoreductase [Antricoccus sp.]